MKFPDIFCFRKRKHAGSVAKQRLLLMNESEPIECAPDVMAHMKQDISDIIGRYLAVPAEEYEIKVILKHKKTKVSEPEPASYNFDTSVAFTTQ